VENPTFSLLKQLGFRRRASRFILDEFSHDFYLLADGEPDADDPVTHQTVDIYVMPIGSYPAPIDGTRIIGNAGRAEIAGLLALVAYAKLPQSAQDCIINESAKTVLGG